MGDEGYAIPGGHVVYKETTEETLIREFKEELNADIKIRNLTAIGEIFFLWDNKPCQQICLYYNIEFNESNQIQLEDGFRGFDEAGDERFDLEYFWIPLEKLSEIEIYPKELVPHILSGSNNIFHFVSRQFL